jgi:hypothetical protein
MRNQAEKAALLSRIRDAFWHNTPPKLPESWKNLTDDIESQNYFEGIEETKPFWGKDWSEIKVTDYENCRDVFSWVPHENLPYFMGGYMTVSLLGPPDDCAFSDMFVLFDPRLERPKNAKQSWALNRMKIAPLNQNQRTIIAAYIKFTMPNELDEDAEFLHGFLLDDIQE